MILKFCEKESKEAAVSLRGMYFRESAKYS